MSHIEQYYEVIERILELLDTLEEGISYAGEQSAELQYEDALVTLNDVMEGIISIFNAMKPMRNEMEKNNIDTLLADIEAAMRKVVDSYEQDRKFYLEREITEEVLPYFKNWKHEVERVLKLYIAS